MGILDNIGMDKVRRRRGGAASQHPPVGAVSAAATTTKLPTDSLSARPAQPPSRSKQGVGPTASGAPSGRPPSSTRPTPSKRGKRGKKRGKKRGASTPRERIATASAPLHDRRRRLVGARESTLRDLGGLMLEMYKRNRFREELLLDKCEEVLAIEVEIAHVDQRLFQLAPPNAAGMRPIGRCECDAPIYPGQNFCGVCGRSFATLTQARACARCGAGLRRGDQYCASCGTEAPDSLQAIEAPIGPPSASGADAARIASSAVADTVVIEAVQLPLDQSVPTLVDDPTAATVKPTAVAASAVAAAAPAPVAAPDVAIAAAVDSLPPRETTAPTAEPPPTDDHVPLTAAVPPAQPHEPSLDIGTAEPNDVTTTPPPPPVLPLPQDLPSVVEPTATSIGETVDATSSVVTPNDASSSHAAPIDAPASELPPPPLLTPPPLVEVDAASPIPSIGVPSITEPAGSTPPVVDAPPASTLPGAPAPATPPATSVPTQPTTPPAAAAPAAPNTNAKVAAKAAAKADARARKLAAKEAKERAKRRAKAAREARKRGGDA